MPWWPLKMPHGGSVSCRSPSQVTIVYTRQRFTRLMPIPPRHLPAAHGSSRNSYRSVHIGKRHSTSSIGCSAHSRPRQSTESTPSRRGPAAVRALIDLEVGPVLLLLAEAGVRDKGQVGRVPGSHAVGHDGRE